MYISLKLDNTFGHDYRPGEPLYAIVNRDQKQRRLPSSHDNYSPNENIHFWNGDEFGNLLIFLLTNFASFIFNLTGALRTHSL